MTFDFETRRQRYIQQNKNAGNTYSLLLKAYVGEPLDENLLITAYNTYSEHKKEKKDNSDFDMVQLLRILFLTKTQEQHLSIWMKLDELFKDEHFWLFKDAKSQCFWSENHMIAYLSSWQLWNEYNNKTDEHCEQLLTAYLLNKSIYFCYEFYSQVYNTYTISALLNIYDFTTQPKFKELAKVCIDVLFRQLTEVVNLNGTTFCASGRTYKRYKMNSDGNNSNKLVYLLTGLSTESDLSPIGAFLATTTFQPNENCGKDTHDHYERTYHMLHAPNEFTTIYKDLSKTDRTLFQWSAGNYFNKDGITDTVNMIDEYNLWGHSHFNIDKYKWIIKCIPRSILRPVSAALSSFTGGSTLCDATYRIYNHNYYTLTSIEDYNKGKLGAQQFPWVANIGGCSVYTQSGKVGQFGNMEETIGNTHLPYVKQSKNVMMIMYKPSFLLQKTKTLAKLNTNVYLKWGEFDKEVREENWLYGMKTVNMSNEVYAAVYSTDKLQEDGDKNIYNSKTKQGWIVIAGDNDEYTDFSNFQNHVKTNTKIYFGKDRDGIPGFPSNTYYGEIQYKQNTITMKW